MAFSVSPVDCSPALISEISRRLRRRTFLDKKKSLNFAEQDFLIDSKAMVAAWKVGLRNWTTWVIKPLVPWLPFSNNHFSMRCLRCLFKNWILGHRWAYFKWISSTGTFSIPGFSFYLVQLSAMIVSFFVGLLQQHVRILFSKPEVRRLFEILRCCFVQPATCP